MLAEKRIGRNVDTGVCTLTRIVLPPYKSRERFQEFSFLLRQDKSQGGQKVFHAGMGLPNKLEGSAKVPS